MSKKRLGRLLARHAIALAGAAFLTLSVTLFALGSTVVLDRWGEDWSRAVSEAGDGLFAAAIVTFAVEPLNHSLRTGAITAILLAHEERLLRNRMTDLVFSEFKSSVLDQHFRRVGVSFDVRLEESLPDQKFIPEGEGFIQKRQRISYYLFNLEHGTLSYVLTAAEEQYNRFIFLSAAGRITRVHLKLIETAPLETPDKPPEAFTYRDLCACKPKRTLFLAANEDEVKSTMKWRQDAVTATIFEGEHEIAGQTWVRVSIDTMAILANRGASPFVVSHASDGLRLRVTYPPGLHVVTSALSSVGLQFPFVAGTGAVAEDGMHAKEWHVTTGLLPNQGLELMWYPVEAMTKRGR